MKRKHLRKSDIRKLQETVKSLYGVDLLQKTDTVEEVVDDLSLVYVNERPLFFYHGDRLVPTLKLLLEQDLLKKVVVDMGAVRFVTNGADVMRPGIVAIDPAIKTDEVVVVVDENNNKPLGVGIARCSGEKMQMMESGKVVTTIHHVGDPLWNL
ncbi:MAG: DUF1947 domain-containing protein [Nanobdellota archaeon]